MAIAHFNSSLNPVLYAVAWVKLWYNFSQSVFLSTRPVFFIIFWRNPAFQRGYRKVFLMMCCKEARVDQSSMGGHTSLRRMTATKSVNFRKSSTIAIS
jgi:hypothetical protein